MYLLSDHVSLFVAVLTHTEHTFYNTDKVDNIINGFTDQDLREQLKTLT